MKKLMLVLAVLPFMANAGDFGKEADKSSVAARKSLKLMRVNPATGEKTLFDAASVDRAKLDAFAKVEDGNAAKTDFLASTISKLEEGKGVEVVSKEQAASSPTTAYYGYYYGYYTVYYYRVTYYYYPVYYRPVYYTGYYYYWLY